MGGGILLGLGGLALVDSTSFGTLVLPLVLLAQPRVRVGRVVVYLATIGAFYLVLGLALLTGATWVRTGLAGVDEALSSTTAYVVQAVLGLGLFALSFRYDPKPVARRRAARGGEPRRVERWRDAAMGEHASTRSLVTLALLAGLIEAASMLPYLAAIGIVTTADLPARTSAAIVTGYVLVMLAPAGLLALVRTVGGTRLEGPLSILRDWFIRHTAGALGWVIGAAGVLLILDAVGELASRGFIG